MEQETSNQEGSKPPEVASPEVSENVLEASVENAEVQAQEESQKDTSWLKKLRKDREEFARENRRLEEKALLQEKLLKELAEKAYANPPQQQQREVPEEDVFKSLDEEDYAEGAKVAQALRAVHKKSMAQIEELKRQIEEQKYASKFDSLRKKYPDFDDVVNPSTLALVRKHNPDLADIWKNQDDYSIAVQAYPYLKHSGLLKESDEDRRAEEVEARLAKNKKTIGSAHSLDKRPMAQAFQLSAEERKRLWEETQKYSSMSGGLY